MLGRFFSGDPSKILAKCLAADSFEAALKSAVSLEKHPEPYAQGLLACLPKAINLGQLEQASRRLTALGAGEELRQAHLAGLVQALPRAPFEERCALARYIGQLGPGARFGQTFLLCALSSQPESSAAPILGVLDSLALEECDERAQFEVAKTISNLTPRMEDCRQAVELAERLPRLAGFASREDIRQAYARALANASSLATTSAEAEGVYERLKQHPDAEGDFVSHQAARALVNAAALLENPADAGRLRYLLPPGPGRDAIMEQAGKRHPRNQPVLPGLVFASPSEAPPFAMAVFQAAGHDRVDELREVSLKMPGALKSLGIGSQNLLHCAAQNGALRAVQYLISQGLDVNAGTTGTNVTPLLFAARGGHTDIARVLIEHGVDVNAAISAHDPRYPGMTALDAARASGNEALARLLLEAGAQEAPVFIVGIEFVGPGVTDQGLNLDLKAASEDEARAKASSAVQGMLEGEQKAQLESALGVRIEGFRIVEVRRKH